MLQKELIDEAKKNADKADKEIIEATKARNKEIADANEEHNKDANKEAEKWAKKKLELLSEISIAEQDELAKPYIKLEQEYQKDLMEFGKTQEQKDLITKDYLAYRDWETDRKSTRLNSSHRSLSRMPSSA